MLKIGDIVHRDKGDFILIGFSPIKMDTFVFKLYGNLTFLDYSMRMHAVWYPCDYLDEPFDKSNISRSRAWKNRYSFVVDKHKNIDVDFYMAKSKMLGVEKVLKLLDENTFREYLSKVLQLEEYLKIKLKENPRNEIFRYVVPFDKETKAASEMENYFYIDDKNLLVYNKALFSNEHNFYKVKELTGRTLYDRYKGALHYVGTHDVNNVRFTDGLGDIYESKNTYYYQVNNKIFYHKGYYFII